MARDDKSNTLTGLTVEEAKAFHGLFMGGFIGFTIIAIIAHFLVWSMFRTWFPGTGGYAELQDTATQLASLATTFLT
jgi:light-harvesting complex 1 beta chain